MVKLFEINKNNQPDIHVTVTDRKLSIFDYNLDKEFPIFEITINNRIFGTLVGLSSYYTEIPNITELNFRYDIDSNYYQQIINFLEKQDFWPKFLFVLKPFVSNYIKDFPYKEIVLIDLEKDDVNKTYSSIELGYRDIAPVLTLLSDRLSMYTSFVLLAHKTANLNDLKQISEKAKNIVYKNYFQMITKIKNDCQQYLKEIQYNPEEYVLYRGLNTVENFVIKQSRLENRKPKDTHSYVHIILNDFFEDTFGWKARNGVFATGSYETASSYALDNVPHIFFPIGKYKYLWSPLAEDLYSTISNEIERFRSLHRRVTTSDIVTIVRDVASDLKYEYTDSNLIEGIKLKTEIMFNVDKYYGVKASGKKLFLSLLKEKINK